MSRILLQVVDVPKDANISRTSSDVPAPKTRANVPKSNPKASNVSKPKHKPKEKGGFDLSRKRKLSDDKEDSGEPVKLSKKSKVKIVKGKRVLYSSSSSLGTDEVELIRSLLMKVVFVYLCCTMMYLCCTIPNFVNRCPDFLI